MFMRFDESFIGYVFCFVPVKEDEPVNDNGWSIDRDMEQVVDGVFMTFRRNVRIYECKFYHIEDYARCKSMHIAVHNSPDLEERLIFTLSKGEFEMDDWCFWCYSKNDGLNLAPTIFSEYMQGLVKGCL